jgi:hypothetical protein
MPSTINITDLQLFHYRILSDISTLCTFFGIYSNNLGTGKAGGRNFIFSHTKGLLSVYNFHENTVVPPHQWVLCSKTYCGQVKRQIP